MQIITFGCRLNTFETAVMKQLVGNKLDDVIMIHTCAVTAEAERQCRQAIRQAARKNPDKKIIVAGCAAQLHPEIFAQMPEVYRVLGNHEKLDMAFLTGTDKVDVGDLSEPPPSIPLIHEIEGRNRAFLQIQQGCDHACTFCIVHTLRGKNTGLHPDRVLKQAQLFVDQGYPEIVLTGVDVASYPYGLWTLTERLLIEVSGLKRLRFGSLDPAMVGAELLKLLGKYENLMPYIHLSVQSGDNLILKRMGRRHTREDVIRFATELKKVRKDATLGADFIAGFPTETPLQFEHTLDLIEKADITHTHIFPYSARTGTPAAKMPQIVKAERIKRAAVARDRGAKLYQKALDNMVGKTVSILVEQTGIGYTENYFPVRVGKSELAGQIIKALIKGKENNELVI